MRKHDSNNPNPVAEVIGRRTLEVSTAAILALTVIRRTHGPGAVRAMVPAVSALTVAGLSAFFAATFHPRARFPGTPEPLSRMPWGDAVALTFDDGPFAVTTPRLLDLLAAADAKATFFLVGERAAACPNIVRRIAREGHAIGIHGMRHRTMALLTAPGVANELTAARSALEDALGAALPRRIFRPPYGFASWTLCHCAARLGWKRVAWSLDSRDYADGATEVSIADRVRGKLRAGDIVLLHERPQGVAAHAASALPAILGNGRERGWVFRAIEL